jgi:hypothetical protein
MQEQVLHGLRLRLEISPWYDEGSVSGIRICNIKGIIDKEFTPRIVGPWNINSWSPRSG